jgi:hypothetical protein
MSLPYPYQNCFAKTLPGAITDVEIGTGMLRAAPNLYANAAGFTPAVFTFSLLSP